MAKHRATFGKLQRERDKKAKAAAKRERRAARGDAEDAPEEEVPVKEHDEARVLAALESLHKSYDEGNLSIDEFEARREELTSRIRI
jgi:ATPase subunit of ABC transporter with duplicated ATPase domains